MQAKLTEEEIRFCELFFNPIALLENLIPLDLQTTKPLDNPANWDVDTPCINIRLYQLPFLSYEYMVVNDPELTPKQNFERKIGAGQTFNYSGRGIGKSFICLDCDELIDIIHNDNYLSCFASFDGKHIRTRMEWVCNYVENHPFFKMFHLTGRTKSVKRGNYYIVTRNGHRLVSVNENIKGKNPGSDYHQHHWNKFYYEENSYETEVGNAKRVDSKDQLGCIERLTGIPAFHKASPAAKIFNDPDKCNWLVRLPELVSPNWDEKEKEERIQKYGGEASAGYRVNVLAEIIEGAYSGFNMEIVRDNYNHDKDIKHFEVNKDNFGNLKRDIILDKLSNAELTYVAADIGYEGQPTEIIIVFKVKGKYLYRYNITLFGLIPEQQEKVLLYIFRKVNADYIALDASEPGARGICDRLEKIIPRKQVIRVWFTQKMLVGFQEDNNGKVIRNDKGDPVEKQEYVDEWSFEVLKDLLYDLKFDIPKDQKFDLQFDGMIQAKSGNRMLYDNMTVNHLLQAFQVLAIAIWRTERSPKPEKRRELSLGIS